MTTQLTPHFTLEELTITQVRDVDNTPPFPVKNNLIQTAFALEEVRDLLGWHPIIVTSGYRSEGINSIVGGSKTSAHMDGWAADFICPSYGTPLEICRAIVEAKTIKYDQLIEEGTWVHFSVDPRMRMQVLTKNPAGGYINGLREEK